MSKTRKIVVSLASLAGLALAGCLAVWAFPLKAPARVRASAVEDRVAAQASLLAAHQKWLDEVSYIVTLALNGSEIYLIGHIKLPLTTLVFNNSALAAGQSVTISGPLSTSN